MFLNFSKKTLKKRFYVYDNYINQSLITLKCIFGSAVQKKCNLFCFNAVSRLIFTAVNFYKRQNITYETV